MSERERKKYIECLFNVKLRRYKGYWTIWKKEKKCFEYQPREWRLQSDRLYSNLDEVIEFLDKDGCFKCFRRNLELFHAVL